MKFGYFIFFATFAFAEMSLEEKVGQLLMVHFNGETVNEEAKKLVEQVRVGGVIYYTWANGLQSPEKVSNLSASLQKMSALPLFIAADQEGGAVVRLDQGFTRFPSNRALRAANDLQLCEESAYIVGEELLAVGVNLNLAPVVDVNSNPLNPVIGVRSFDSSAQSVTIFAERTLNGFRRAGLLSCLKHFPGHGDVTVDSHEMLPVIHKSREELNLVDLYPFSSLCKKADAVMTAHLMAPSIDMERCATFSRKILDILRKEMGFQGVIISDSLVMQGALAQFASLEEAGIEAFNAGCDILLYGGKLLSDLGKEEITADHIQKIHQALVCAVKSGRISEKRLDESIERILRLKENLPKAHSIAIPSEKGKEISQELARLALKVVGNPITLQGNIAIFAPVCAKGALEKSSFSSVLFYEEECRESLQKAAETADFLLCFACDAWKMPEQKKAIEMLAKKKQPFVLVALKDPQDADLFPEAAFSILTYSPDPVSIETVYHRLKEFL